MMESFEFLGGRYNRPEQIMSGPVQAFRAQSAATGRTVYIHRVSTSESPGEQAALLKMLTTALVKSAEAKRLVLDFGDESGYWYVVTEAEPQCALLREWLHLEIESAAARPAVASSSPQRTTPKPPEPAPSTDTGEFTRFLQARPSPTAPTTSSRFVPPAPASKAEPAKTEPAPGEFTQLFQPPAAAQAPPPAPPAAPPPVKDQPAPGEFTSFFNSNQAAERKPPAPQRPNTPPPAAPPAPLPSEPQGGEFTRFFTPGLPPSAPKPPTPEVQRPRPYVQRPNTPVPPVKPAPPPPPPQKPAPEPGEFTQLFSRPTPQAPPPQPLRNDPLGFSKPAGQPHDLSDDLFSDRIDIPSPQPSSKPDQGEFTRMFGPAGVTPPAPPVVAPPREKPILDEAPRQAAFQPTQPLPTQQSGTEAPAHTPSEFTMIMQGGYGTPKPPAEPAESKPAATSVPLPSGLKMPPVKPAIPAVPKPPAPSIPKPAVPSFQVPAAAPAGNKKLIIFFAIIGVLAVLLVLLMLFVMKTK